MAKVKLKGLNLVADIQGIEFYSPETNPTLIITYNENYHIDAVEDVQKACRRIFKNYYEEELFEHLKRQKKAFEKIKEPAPIRYYEPELDLDGTADELFIQARNGYIDNPEALHRVAEILTLEGKTEKAERVRFMEEREKEDDALYSVAGMKLDFMDGLNGGCDEVQIQDGLYLTVMFEPSNQTVCVSLRHIDDEDSSIGSTALSLEDFKKMSRKDFELLTGQIFYYNMVPDV